uniref:GHMP_kinases_C domain-containing protein n=1 Tax=Caenorhabditis tropicalis TaxID=1561998 RepID=A0A1I7UMG7_9PELO
MTRCEPPIVTELLETLKRLSMISVGWAAGAGGGGFLYLWLSAPRDSVQQFIQSRFPKMTCHQIRIPLVPPVTLK